MKLMLASATDGTNLKYPLLASPKIDGIRAVVLGWTVYSRNMKPIPNAHVQALFGRPELDGLDGELVVGAPYGNDVFRRTTSGVMAKEGAPDVTFFVFDRVGPGPYRERLASVEGLRFENVRVLAHKVIETEPELGRFEEHWLEQGYEGVMLRDPLGPYKHGRSTLREGLLLKLKRFSDAEATVLGWEEQMENTNEAIRNAAGRLERSSAKAGKVGKGVLGALRVHCLETGAEFHVGTGFTDEDRASLWAERESLEGRTIRYRFFAQGSKDKPRFPVFAGFRRD